MVDWMEVHRAPKKLFTSEERGVLFEWVLKSEADQRITELEVTINRVREIPADLRDDFSRGGLPTGALEAIWYIEDALKDV